MRRKIVGIFSVFFATIAFAARQGGPIPVPLPLFPPGNWWNADITNAPVDPASTSYINFIGPSRGLHPDFGGDAGGGDVYGFPYVIVDGSQPKVAVTFDYSDDASPEAISGEIVICLDEAFLQASSFETIWQSELVRYVVHGILHLRGYDDSSSEERRKMKRAEEVLMGRVARDFDFRKLAAH